LATSPRYSNLKEAKAIISSETTIFWMRRDLRLKDNAALYQALRENKEVVVVFIFDTIILDALDDKYDKRVEFILSALQYVQEQLVAMGSSLVVLHGDPVELFRQLSPKSVYTNEDYEQYAVERDNAVSSVLEAKKTSFNKYKDHVIFSKLEVLKSDGTPYTVFTPYSKQWKAKLKPFFYKAYPTEKYFKSFKRMPALRLPELAQLGFLPTGGDFPPRMIRKKIIAEYEKTRDYPGVNGTSRLGVHLRFGTVSIREAVRVAITTNETWLNELIWRDFFSMILAHFPHVEDRSFKPAFDRINWRNNEQDFKRWCEGNTGYPIVDAGMRELNDTGFMHNRVRMIVASFLTKHLLIDWRWGEAYFAKKLLDYDLASNVGGWQWAAGSGCDAAPYFRIFNPTLQTERFDKQLNYIKKWVPEFNTDKYVRPMVDHQIARDRALKTFQQALGK
jgi:deoxyribodipyrimidine photo-lyase